MPTISDLPAAASAEATDLIPASKEGTTVHLSQAQLTAGLKRDSVSQANRLLGRASAGAGAIEELALGQGLAIEGGALVAQGGSAGPLEVVAQIDPQPLDDSANGANNGAFAAGSTWLNRLTGSLFACLDATPGRAVWTRVNDFVGLRSDRWYTGPYAQITSAPSHLSWNAHLVRIARRATIDRVAVRVTTAGAAASRITIALYANQNGLPGEKLHDFATIATGLDTLGPKTPAATASYEVAVPGWYWMATQVDNGGGTMPALQCTNATPQLNNDVGDFLLANILGTSTTHGVLVSATALASFGMPAVAPSVSHQARVPLVAFGIAG